MSPRSWLGTTTTSKFSIIKRRTEPQQEHLAQQTHEPFASLSPTKSGQGQVVRRRAASTAPRLKGMAALRHPDRVLRAHYKPSVSPAPAVSAQVSRIAWTQDYPPQTASAATTSVCQEFDTPPTAQPISATGDAAKDAAHDIESVVDEICPICQETLDMGDAASRPELENGKPACRHVFCEECLIKARSFRSPYTTSCPYCRQKYVRTGVGVIEPASSTLREDSGSASEGYVEWRKYMGRKLGVVLSKYLPGSSLAFWARNGRKSDRSSDCT